MRQTQVLVASEYAPVRRMLTDMVAAEEGFKVAGEAGNDVEARAMARQMKPDVVLLDFRLPYVMGCDEVRLSRVSGLDAAMAITEDVPGARVVLLANLDGTAYRDSNHGDKCLATDANGIRAVFTLRDLCCGTVANAGPVFANIEFRERVAVGSVSGGSGYTDFFGKGRTGVSRRGGSKQTPGETLMVIGAAMVTFSVLFFLAVTFTPLMGSNPYVGIFAWFSSPLIFISGLFALGIGFFMNRKGQKRRGFSQA